MGVPSTTRTIISRAEKCIRTTGVPAARAPCRRSRWITVSTPTSVIRSLSMSTCTCHQASAGVRGQYIAHCSRAVSILSRIRCRCGSPRRLRLESIDRQHQDTIALLCGPLVLFAISAGSERPRRSELLATRQVAQRRWETSVASGSVTFLPYVAIDQEQYSTFVTLAGGDLACTAIDARCAPPSQWPTRCPFAFECERG